MARPHLSCSRSHPGIIQYDASKSPRKGKLIVTRVFGRPPWELLTAVNDLRADPHHPGLHKHLARITNRLSEGNGGSLYPGDEHDVLYAAGYKHRDGEDSCQHCDTNEASPRTSRTEVGPVVHYGLIASGNQVVKHGRTRDRLRDRLRGQFDDILCFEMEAAGVAAICDCLVICGISDHADSHKNNMWKGYAAPAAAAYAKVLLEAAPGN